ncbi:hypothetical protein [Oerskovia jenensis]|uniref:hypothetical protein n=1 Tax=Oerskovia jenensis TaxID=162169 RepID=UPI0036DE4708
MSAHALGAAAHAAKAAALAAPDQEASRRAELRWQFAHMTSNVRTYRPGAPSSAQRGLLRPLGAGLLALGVLATTIR